MELHVGGKLFYDVYNLVGFSNDLFVVKSSRQNQQKFVFFAHRMYNFRPFTAKISDKMGILTPAKPSFDEYKLSRYGRRGQNKAWNVMN